VAWTILPANITHAWRRVRWRMLCQLRPAIPRHQRCATCMRLVGICRRGGIVISVARLDHEPLPLGAFLPEPWPTVPFIARTGRVHDSGVLHDVAA